MSLQAVIFIVLAKFCTFAFLGDERSVHVISYKEASPWQVSEEESLNNATPEYLKCDSCLAVASELARAFHKFERHLSRLLADSEILDIVDSVCRPVTFNYYGVTVDNRRKLVGPGFGTEDSKKPMQVLSAGLFPHRLSDMCRTFTELDEIMDEIQIYEYWVRFGRTSKGLVNVLCLNPMAKETSQCVKDNEIDTGPRLYEEEYLDDSYQYLSEK